MNAIDNFFSSSKMTQKLNLNWHTYSDHLKEMLRNLMDSNETADVTLVCDDKTKFKAHKFVLMACSPVFQSIIGDLGRRNEPVIYLRGVFSEVMKSILQFMYLGQTTLFQDRMNEFLNVSKNLEIKELGKNVDYFQKNKDNVSEEDFFEYDPLQVDEKIDDDCSYETNAYENDTYGGSKVKIEKKIANIKTDSDQFSCNQCEKQYSYKRNLKQHVESAHEGIKYPCDICNREFNQKVHLVTHMKLVHKTSV